uniref:Uncharacterized protein n=1 Tax=Gallus gallus TaxID=9031 RepID=A0A8V0Y7T2_CHICK
MYFSYPKAEGWNTDGSGLNVWDIFTHQGGDRVFKNQTGDVACGSYTLWEEDLKCIKQLGLTHYRFSLSWSRLLPDGTTGFINQKGNCFLKIEGCSFNSSLLYVLSSFGLFHINPENSNIPCTPYTSAKDYAKDIKTN